MQAKILSMFHEHESAKLILSYQDQVQPNDKTNREGHAAKVYFNALWGLEFERRTSTPVNAMRRSIMAMRFCLLLFRVKLLLLAI